LQASIHDLSSEGWRILTLRPSLRMSGRRTAAVSQTSAHCVSSAFRACHVLRLGFAIHLR
jgi:hypothetical protein